MGSSPGRIGAIPPGSLHQATVGVSLLSLFPMGIDFPASNRRFSRLAATD